MPYLLLVGTASIQDYVFRSNRLRENLGASDLVRWAGRWWQSPNGRRTLAEQQGSLIYVGGGNAAITFNTEPGAIAAVRCWSRSMLSEAPGLRVVVAGANYDAKDLPAAFQTVRAKLGAAENRPPLGSELGALPWVRRCPSTGWAASEKAEPTHSFEAATPDPEETEGGDETELLTESSVWLSAEAHAKRNHYWEKTRHRIQARYRAVLPRRFRFPRDLSRLGTVEGASHIALVHADGNGIGQWIQDRLQNATNSEEFQRLLAENSRILTELGEASFDRLLQDLGSRLEALERNEVIRLHRDGRGCFFPVRPVVDDGDDLTFVCAGKLGIALAVRYLEVFQHQASQRGLFLTACAGVVVMPQKFPFAQGYILAEELCSNAKRMHRKHGGSWLDVHVQMEGRSPDLQQARTQYPRWGSLHFPRRPWRLGPEQPSQPSWTEFEAVHDHMIANWPRSEVKELLATYASGEKSTGILLESLKKKQLALSLPSDMPVDQAFDVAELADHYCPVFADSGRMVQNA